MDKTHVKEMFDDIAPRYDLLNRLLTAGIDITWRKKAVKSIKLTTNDTVVDVACGTGDLALEIYKQHKPNKILGLDLSPEMLRVGESKINQKGLSQKIELKEGNGESIELPNEFCEAVTIGFGIRNFQNPQKGLSEFFRILKPNGVLMVLEFSMPTNPLFAAPYRYYFNHVLPFIGRIISKNSGAYTYLPESVADFAHGKNFCELLEKTGFSDIKTKSLTFGIATIYTCRK